MEPSSYEKLTKASLSKDFLCSNSTTHNFVFGAIAEFVDNARDAEAKNLFIDQFISNDGKICLSFLDDGNGMNPKDLYNVVNYGHSLKSEQFNKVGKYGNGLKSGSMRIARDCLVLSKKDGIQSALFLSKSFLQENNLDEIFVPMPSFYVNSRSKYIPPGKSDIHDLECEAIAKHSPFGGMKLFEAFSKITGKQGTLVILFNLRCNIVGDSELIFKEVGDIRINGSEFEPPEKTSLRAYLSILYCNPKMRMFICKKEVCLQRIVSDLYAAVTYKFEPKRVTGALEKQKEELENRLKLAIDKVNELKSDHGTLTTNFAKSSERTAQRKKTEECVEAEKQKKNIEDEIKRIKKGHKISVELHMGLNIKERKRYGAMLYNNGRLIEMYVKPDCQKKHRDQLDFYGLVAVVDLPYNLILPCHNKQSFENTKDRNIIIRTINDYMGVYWRSIILELTAKKPLQTLWSDFGYSNVLNLPSDLPDTVKIYKTLGFTAMCVKCFNWRKIPFQFNLYKPNALCSWSCRDHPLADQRSCTLNENLAQLNPSKKGTMSMLPAGKRRKQSSSIDVDPSSDNDFLRKKPEAGSSHRTVDNSRRRKSATILSDDYDDQEREEVFGRSGKRLKMVNKERHVRSTSSSTCSQQRNKMDIIEKVTQLTHRKEKQNIPVNPRKLVTSSSRSDNFDTDHSDYIAQSPIVRQSQNLLKASGAVKESGPSRQRTSVDNVSTDGSYVGENFHEINREGKPTMAFKKQEHPKVKEDDVYFPQNETVPLHLESQEVGQERFKQDIETIMSYLIDKHCPPGYNKNNYQGINSIEDLAIAIRARQT